MQPIYEVNIDFDEASKEWNKNKKRKGQSYVYVCGVTTKNGSCCQNKRLKGKDFCHIHVSKNFSKIIL